MAHLKSSAVRYALRALHVFPLSPGTKIPLRGTHGLRDASRDPDKVRAWWVKWPSANIAAATGRCSGIWVLDVDAHHDGDKSLAKIEDDHGPLPLTVEASTPRGGRHLYWQWPASGPESRNSASRVGPGLDVLAEGGSVTLPPSTLSNGGRYRWAKNGASSFTDAPAWLVALALPPPASARPEPQPLNGDVDRYVASAAASELTELETATEGTRNDALNHASFNLAQFVKAGALPEDWTREQLEARAIQIGLPALEARRTIDSAFRAAQPRSLPR